MNCTFLSFWVPAKPCIAKDLIEADDIGSLLFENLSFTIPLNVKCYKLKKFEACEAKKV